MATVAPSSAPAGAEPRAAYPHFLAIATRWQDTDAYGHVNNVVYYSFFDTVINRYLIEAGGLDFRRDPVVGYTAESQCRYLAALDHPGVIDAGLRVAHIGTRSVRYEIALYRQGENQPAASGHFVHVFVDRATNKPAPIPPGIRAALEKLLATT